MTSFGNFLLNEPEIPDDVLANLQGIPKTNPNATQTNPVRSTPEMATVAFGPFQGKTYQELADDQNALIKKHERPLPTPNACGERCSLPYNFIRWYHMAYRKELDTCNSLPYYVRIRKLRMPDNDPKYPGHVIQDVWEKDRDYLKSLKAEEVTVSYMIVLSLVKSKLNRKDGFPSTIRSKHAGRSFDDVAATSPDYFDWILSQFTGKENSYHDAADWWLENKDKYKMQAAAQMEAKVVSSELTGNETFASGKYQGRSFLDVFGVNPGYYTWLENNYKGIKNDMLDAIAWYRKARANGTLPTK